MSKTLILIPGVLARGGITNFYSILRKYYTDDIIYLERGARFFPYRKVLVYELIRLIRDYCRYISILINKKIDLVQTTTSLGKKSVLRDGLYIILAKFLGKKVIVFYRGWDIEYAGSILRKWHYRIVYFKWTNASIVLASSIKKNLEVAGYLKKIYLESTVVDDEFFEDAILTKYNNRKLIKKEEINLLYLARLEKSKGVYELLNAYKELKAKFKNIKLSIAGDGTEEKRIQEYINKEGLEDIFLKGFVNGEEKKQVYKTADVYVFPSYTEGMPNSVLEAMAFGLPILTTPVGGIVDFFKNGINGYFLKIKDYKSILTNCEYLITKCVTLDKIAQTNHNLVKKSFMASKIAHRNEEIFQEVIKQK